MPPPPGKVSCCLWADLHASSPPPAQLRSPRAGDGDMGEPRGRRRPLQPRLLVLLLIAAGRHGEEVATGFGLLVAPGAEPGGAGGGAGRAESGRRAQRRLPAAAERQRNPASGLGCKTSPSPGGCGNMGNSGERAGLDPTRGSPALLPGGAGLGQPRCRWGAAWEGPSTLQGIAVYWRRKSAAESSAVTTQAGTRPGEGFAPRPQPSACKLLGFCAKPCPPVPTGPAGVPFCRSQLGGRAAAPRRVLGPSQDRSRALQQPPNWGAPGEPGGDTATTAQKAPALWGEGFGDGDGDKQTSLRSFPGQVPAGKRRGCVLG